MACFGIGNYNKKPHISIIGSPCDFYVFINDGIVEYRKMWSNRITSRVSLYHELKTLCGKNKVDFEALCRKLHKENIKK
jgi:hypothetical protein